MVFPLFKITGLFAKAVLKPVSNRIQLYARRSPGFTNGCYFIANSYSRGHNLLCKSLRIPYQVKQLTPDQAVELGVGLVGEGLLIAGATGVLYWEYHRSSKISPDEELRRAKLIELDHRVSHLEAIENKKNYEELKKRAKKPEGEE